MLRLSMIYAGLAGRLTKRGVKVFGPVHQMLKGNSFHHMEIHFNHSCEVIDILIVGVHGDIDDHLPVSLPAGLFCQISKQVSLVLRPMFQVLVSSVMNFRSVEVQKNCIIAIVLFVFINYHCIVVTWRA
ncbi:uncharacterized protein [Dysidea avara]|uniref:uncharacterized protein isoform X1 n=1 Tax=Dysidea avara TaxID=196820 RepID=UPI00331D8D15